MKNYFVLPYEKHRARIRGASTYRDIQKNRVLYPELSFLQRELVWNLKAASKQFLKILFLK